MRGINMPDVLPLTQQSIEKLQPLTLERNKFITKGDIGINQENAITQGLLESQLASTQQTQELIARKTAAEQQRQFQEQQLQLQKEQIQQQKKSSESSMLSEIPVIGPVLGLLKG